MTATETAKQRAKRFMSDLEASGKATYQKGEVKTILNTIAQAADDPNRADEDDDAIGCRSPFKADSVKRGDVFISKALGGKVRPWVVLRVSGDTVYACPMSSKDSSPGMIKSECRFWPNSWIGPSAVCFSMEWATREVTRPFTKPKQLAEIEAAVSDAIKAPRKASNNVRDLKVAQ